VGEGQEGVCYVTVVCASHWRALWVEGRPRQCHPAPGQFGALCAWGIRGICCHAAMGGGDGVETSTPQYSPLFDGEVGLVDPVR
jgi:hypothetical protein